MAEGDRKAGRKTTPRRRSDPGKADAADLRRESRRLARELKALQTRCGALEERIEKDQRERRDVELRAGRLESELAQAERELSSTRDAEHAAASGAARMEARVAELERERERDAAQAEALAAKLRAAREPHEAAKASMGAAETALAQAQAAVKQAVKACAAAAGRGQRQVELRKVAEREVELLRTALENAETRVLTAAGVSHDGAAANKNGSAPAPGRNRAAKRTRSSTPAGKGKSKGKGKRKAAIDGGSAVLTEHWRSAAHVAIRARLARQEAGRYHLEQLKGPAEAGRL